MDSEFGDINDATKFAAGDFFCCEHAVRAYFDHAYIQEMYGPEEYGGAAPSQEELDAMAETVVEAYWWREETDILAALSREIGEPRLRRWAEADDERDITEVVWSIQHGQMTLEDAAERIQAEIREADNE